MVTFAELETKKQSIAVVGLGYVGLPLAVSLAKHFSVIGFDIAAERVHELKTGVDRTGEVANSDLQKSTVHFTSNPAELGQAAIIIVAVPTPITRHRQPDLTPVFGASRTVGKHMGKGCIVVYESTVYPGVTEDECGPILEEASGMKLGVDFHLGYSPERINPGDKVHTVENIVKVVSGDCPATADILASVYGRVITAGIYCASSIKVAEAAKVIENTQRDLNIALMNELALIFDKLGIDTLDVLQAAGTKWNFLPFRPGLVGGHCIGVDPYYLTHKAESVGYHPQVILAGRRINDGMGKFIAEKTIKLLIGAHQRIHDAKVGIFGFTFKENVPDLRNTRVIDIYHELQEYGVQVLVHDPMADAAEAQHEYAIELANLEAMQDLDAVILAVNHESYTAMPLAELKKRFANKDKAVLLDVKGVWSHEDAASAGFTYWRL